MTAGEKACVRCGSSERYASGGCKPCKAAAGKVWYAANRERKAATDRAWVDANRDKSNGYKLHHYRKKRSQMFRSELMALAIELQKRMNQRLR